MIFSPHPSFARQLCVRFYSVQLMSDTVISDALIKLDKPIQQNSPELHHLTPSPSVAVRLFVYLYYLQKLSPILRLYR